MTQPQKLTAQQLANALGLNVDTIRKHAKKGKIKGYQDANGRWTFFASDFPQLGSTTPAKPAPIAKKAKRLTDVIFVLDRSVSMQGLITQARQNLANQIAVLKADADAENKYRISVINFDTSIDTTTHGADVQWITDTDKLYLDPNGWTKLNDAIVAAASLAKTLDANDPSHALLISVVTDGEDNRSVATAYTVKELVQKLTATDRYTFTFAGPAGSSYKAANLGFGAGNITEWEQSLRGTQTLGAQSVTSYGGYTQMRRRDIASATSFYAAPVTKQADKFANQLDNKLDDVSSQVKVERVTALDPIVINKFCEKKFGSFPKGQIYYQLTESEKVQDYKKLIIQDTATGTFYAGETAAKKLLGVPTFQGTVNIKPGSLGEFKIFVQSTSYNRKLTPGTTVVYLP